MESFTGQILTTIALIFVLEGALYALFPDFMKKLLETIRHMEPEQLRMAGMFMALGGLTFIWILQYF